MVNFGPNFQNKIALSPSRVSTFKHCSQKYYCNYILKMPDKGNSGSQRGSTTHDAMEFLELDANKKYQEEILKENTVRGQTIVWDKVLELAKTYTVDDEENLQLIDQFIVTALKFDRPPNNMKESFSERSFDFEEIDLDRGVNYRARGRFDKYYIIEDLANRSLGIIYRDYKTSKAKYGKADLIENLQGGIYQLALKYLHPEINIEKFEFIFVKFKNQPIQEFSLLSESQLEGFKLYLTSVQSAINSFGQKNIGDNLGILNYKMKNLCGPAKSGWICPHQKPLDYYVLIDENQNIIKSAFTEEELGQPEEGQKVELKSYKGCVWFYDENGKKRTNPLTH